MDEFMIDVTAVRPGAACLPARSPLATAAVAGAVHALVPSLAPAAGRVDGRLASWLAPVAQPSQQPAQHMQSAVRTAGLSPMTGTGIATVTRKPKNVHKTRINAGGYGAMGPHPERERLA